jgi:hypothetical protein
MFGLFKRRPDGSGPTPSLNSIRFDTSDYEYRGEPRPGEVRVWFTPEGDGVGLYFFALSPDLPSGARSVADLRAFYAAKLQASGGQLVETSVVRAGGCPAVLVLFKTPQQPSGMTYVGSLTIPFRDFSYVVKVQCEEGGPTGLRESVLMERRLAAGEIPMASGGRLHMADWNPDAAEFDAEFPDHPLSRLRRVLQRIIASLVAESTIARLPGFPLPAPPA